MKNTPCEFGLAEIALLVNNLARAESAVCSALTVLRKQQCTQTEEFDSLKNILNELENIQTSLKPTLFFENIPSVDGACLGNTTDSGNK